MMRRSPAETFPPAIFLRDELDARGWSEMDFASRIEIDIAEARELLRGKLRITPDIAKRLAAAFGDDDADYWISLESAYERTETERSSALAVRG